MPISTKVAEAVKQLQKLAAKADSMTLHIYPMLYVDNTQHRLKAIKGSLVVKTAFTTTEKAKKVKSPTQVVMFLSELEALLERHSR